MTVARGQGTVMDAKQLARLQDYLYRNAPYDNMCEGGRSVYGFSGEVAAAPSCPCPPPARPSHNPAHHVARCRRLAGKAMVKFMLESKHKKTGLNDVTEDAAAIALGDALLASRQAHS